MGAIRHWSAAMVASALIAFPAVHFHPNPFFFSLAGLFVVSMVSNATPFFGASYTLIATAELISFGFSVDAFVLVVGITALGAAIGKLVIYLGAIGFKRQLSRNKNVQLLAQWLERREFFVALFVTAVIPLLPLDDYIFIGAGATKSRFIPIGAVTIAAKLVKSAFEIGLEFLGILKVATLTGRYLGLSSFQFSILLSIVMLILGVFLFKYNWGRLLGYRAFPAPKGTPESPTGAPAG